jgi:hypothetical protein
MGTRITFRERSGNGAVSDEAIPPALSIVEQRIKFVEGKVQEGTGDGEFVACGDGTAYPIEVTVDQMMEVLCRVRNSKFTEGSFSYPPAPGGPPRPPLFAVHKPSVTPSSSTPFEFDEDSTLMVFRGYGHVWTDSDGSDIPSDGERFFSGATASGGHHWRATLSDELAIFYEPEGGYDAAPPFYSSIPSGYAPAGFSYYSARGGVDVAGAINWFGPRGNGGTYVHFTRKVAWVDVSGSGNPLDSANKRFLGVKFLSLWNLMTGIFTDKNIYSGGPVLPAGAKFKFKLSGGSTIECPIYSDEAPSAASDIVMEATEWWPYATTTGGPAWGQSTGLPLGDIGA